MSYKLDILALKVGFMQLYNILSSGQSSVWRELQRFKAIISRNEIWRPKEDVQFVFLCGANIKPGTPSKRRENLLAFSSQNLPHTKFFLAESIFNTLESEGNKTNLLDIENDLSQFADYVVVILESESAFCELGAFAMHKELRNKIIVINDSLYRNSESFINRGPIQAVSEISGGNRVLHYRMDPDGKIHGDGIGVTFPDLRKLIHREPELRRSRARDCNPNLELTKDALRFIHDLIYFSTPVYIAELSRIIKVLFATSKEKQLQKYIGLLCALEQIKRTPEGLYCSLQNASFFEYANYDAHNLIASFRNMYFRYDKQRLQ